MKKLRILVFIMLLSLFMGRGDLSAAGFYGGGSGDATTVNSAAVPASKTVVGTNSSGQVIDASSATLANNTTGNAATATNLVNTPIYSLGTVAGTDTYTATAAPTLASYASGQRFYGLVTNASTSATPTLNVTSKGAITIVRYGGLALVAGDIPAGHIAQFWYNGTNMILMNPGQPPASITGSLTFSQAAGAGAGYVKFAEDPDHGTNTVQLIGAHSTADVIVTLPAETGTVCTTGSVCSGYAPSTIIASSISDSDTTHCPDGNSVYDALAGKAPSAGTGIVERIGATFDGGGAAIAVNKIAYAHIPYAITAINQWTVICDIDSSTAGIIITPYMDAYAANTLPTTTMCTSGTIPHVDTGANKTNQANWDCNITAIPADRDIAFKVTTAPTASTWCTISLKVTR